MDHLAPQSRGGRVRALFFLKTSDALKLTSVMCYASSPGALSRLGVFWGALSLATLLTAFLSNVWLFTREPVRLPNSDIATTITFKIGLWRVCPTVHRPNSTHRKNFLFLIYLFLNIINSYLIFFNILKY